ncbi:MAG: 30S ribosome-binding factor RbfA [Campylobacteraceae bacterium]
MTPSEIKKKRTESILKELIPQAFSTLEDELLRGLCVTEVQCHKGRYDADVFLDKMMLTKEEMSLVLSRLNKVRNYIQSYCSESEGWFKSPKFTFRFDDLLEEQNHIDELFKIVEKELKKKND